MLKIKNTILTLTKKYKNKKKVNYYQFSSKKFFKHVHLNFNQLADLDLLFSFPFFTGEICELLLEYKKMFTYYTVFSGISKL